MTYDCQTEIDWDVLAKFVGAFATVIAAIIAGYIANKYQKHNLKLAREKMEKELFTEFNKKYDKLNDSLSMLNASMTIDDLRNTVSKIKNNSLYNIVIDYFNLCSEQYYWKEKGRISKEIWGAWHVGMMYYYNNFAVVRDLWKEETRGEGFKSYYLKEGRNFFK